MTCRTLPDTLPSLDLAGALVDVSALRTAWLQREALPLHLRVLGRQGVGKSSLVNALVGETVTAVGLGGVTRGDSTWAAGPLVLTDTPGLEDALAAADALEAQLPALDGVLWVVDGLQPLTRVERQALDDALPRGVALFVVVTRLDLIEPAEREAVLDRVRTLLLARAPLLVRPVDGRRPVGLAAGLAAAPWTRRPRRLRALHRALDDVHAALGYLPDTPSVAAVLDPLVQEWQSAVRHAHEAAQERVRSGEALFRDQALAALHGQVDEGTRLLREQLGAAGLPWTWRPEVPPPLDLWGQTQDLVTGAAGVLRALREQAVAWSQEGTLSLRALADTATARALAAQADQLTAARAAVEVDRAALSDLPADPCVSPPAPGTAP